MPDWTKLHFRQLHLWYLSWAIPKINTSELLYDLLCAVTTLLSEYSHCSISAEPACHVCQLQELFHASVSIIDWVSVASVLELFPKLLMAAAHFFPLTLFFIKTEGTFQSRTQKYCLAPVLMHAKSTLTWCEGFWNYPPLAEAGWTEIIQKE